MFFLGDDVNHPARNAWIALVLCGALAAWWALPPAEGAEPFMPCDTHAQCRHLLDDEAAVCRRPRPQDPLQCFAGLPAPPPAPLLTALALGRRDAAADLAWLRTMQFIGSDHAEQVQYSGLETWAERIVELKPTFTEPAYLSATLMSTIPSRSTQAINLLHLIEPTMAGTTQHWLVFFWLATVYEYAERDIEQAASAYRRAHALGGPRWLAKRADTLDQEQSDCSEMKGRLLQTFAEANRAPSAQNLTGQNASRRLRELLINCYRVEIVRAEAAFLLKHHRTAQSVQELVEAGEMSPPLAPPGLRWVLEKRNPALVPVEETPP